MRTRGWTRGLAAVGAAVALTVTAAGGTAGVSPAQLDKLLGPIALYPDQLLAPMLVCAGNPGKVGALNEWLASHPTPKGSELQEAAAGSGFDDSFVALVLFPDVVAWMAGQPDWTASVGQAFIADRNAVFESIQRLRKKARDAGTLKTTPQQEVVTKTTSSGQQVIVIEPSNPQVVYVPQYNPQVVYTQPSTTVVVQQESSSDAAVAGLIGFTAGIAIGAAIDNDYYYGPYGFHGAYMYNDGWDDWYDAREDAREDWQDHREDIVDERGDRAKNAQEQRTERSKTAQEQRTERSQATTQQRTERQPSADQQRSTTRQPAATGASQEARGYTGDARAKGDRSGTSSDAFSGYSSGRSERAASSRGQKSRSSSRSGGSRRR